MDSYGLLKRRAEELKSRIDAFQQYLDLRGYDWVPHSGFGLSLGRAGACNCGLDMGSRPCARETNPLVRTLNQVSPQGRTSFFGDSRNV